MTTVRTRALDSRTVCIRPGRRRSGRARGRRARYGQAVTGGGERRAWAAPAALLGFLLVAAAVALRWTGGFDAWAAEAVRRTASPAADTLARAATLLASGRVTLAVTVAAAAVALAFRARRTAAVLAAAWLASVLGAQALKALFGRARPSFPYTLAALPSPAFPSGHAMNAVIVWGLLAVVVTRRFPAARRPALAAAGLLAIAAGLSRVYLGVHWPTDVLGGWAAGAALLALLAAALPRGAEGAP
jgi:undecaprenyl-diphosphatase